MDESKKGNDVEVKGLSLIDVTLEDDSLICRSSENLQKHRNYEFPKIVDASKEAESADILEQREQLFQPTESLEPERTRKTGKCNLRKSLAWDSAFFTSAGVLEPEELSSMIGGVDSGGKHSLPKIQEDDLHRSTDSISTMQSDGLTLESLDADLFEDIRASIQKSSKMPNIAHSTFSKAGTGENEGGTIHSLKKVDVASQDKVQPKTASRMQGSGKKIKESPARPQATQPVVGSRKSASSLPRLPNMITRANPISTASTKRASLGANRLKMEKDSAKISMGRGAPVSKMTGLGDSHGSVPRPTKSSKSSSTHSSTAEPTASSSSSETNGTALSENVVKSSSNSMRRKFDSRNSNPPSSGSMLKTSTRTAMRNKPVSGNPHLSAYLASTDKPSSSISPASSISEWSIESSSSTSTCNQRVSRAASSPCKGFCEDSDASQIVGSENQVTQMPSQNLKKTTARTGTLHPTSAKPSGLRMPSPKIGFFDGVKALVRTPNGSVQSHSGIPSSLPKMVAGSCSPSVVSNKGKQGKFQPVRTVTPVGNIKPNPQQSSSSVKSASPLPHEEQSNPSTKVSCASRGLRNCHGLSPKIQDDASSKAGGESHYKAKEVDIGGVDRTKHDPDSGLSADKNDSQSASKEKKSPEVKAEVLFKDTKIPPIKGDEPNTTDDSTILITTRVPFAVNNSFCNRDFPATLAEEVVDKADTPPS